MSIISLEQKIMTRDDGGFKGDLLDLLNALERGYPAVGGECQTRNGRSSVRRGVEPLHNQSSFLNNQNYVQRLATAITAFLCSPTLELTEKEVQSFIFLKTHLTDIFFISDFHNMDHILEYRKLWSEEHGFSLQNERDIYLLSICWTINSRINFPFEVLRKRTPDLLFVTLTSALYQLEQFHSHRSFENFHRVFNQFMDLPETVNIAPTITMLVNIWMGCSYWDYDLKHKIKVKVNSLIRKGFWQIPETQKRLPKKIKRVAILAEHYKKEHAVYRCFHPLISTLKYSLETNLFTLESEIDQDSASDATICTRLKPSEMNPLTIAKLIKRYNPDVIIYPSLGMSVWTVILANFRLAPLQMISYGHPASPMSTAIDYGMIGGIFDKSQLQKYCVEELLKANDNSEHAKLSLHPDTDLRVEAKIPQSPEPIRIAINSSLMKISDRLLSVCKIIFDQSITPIEFHFFPGHDRSFKLLAFKKKLQQAAIGDTIVHEPLPYHTYLEALAECSFAIGSIPFGGSNTNIDSVILVQPKIYMIGNGDLAEFTDQNDFSWLDSEGGFGFKSEIEMIAQAIIWIHNPSELMKAKERVREMRGNLLRKKIRQKEQDNNEEISGYYKAIKTASEILEARAQA